MMNKPNIAKRSARSVNRRIAEEGETWPIELYTLGRNCGHALDMVPRQERYMDNRLFSDFINQTVDRFTGCTGDSWNMLACIDRLVELGELIEIPNTSSGAGQHRVFVSYDWQ